MKNKKPLDKEVQDILMLIRDAIGNLDVWSVYHDDQYSDEVYELLSIVHGIENQKELHD